MRTCALQALTSLASNTHIRLHPRAGNRFMLAATMIANHVRIFHPPDAAAPLPSPAAFQACYFLVTTLLRQRERLLRAAVPMILSSIRGLLYTLVNRPNPDEARTMRRLLEALVPQKKWLMRYMKYPLEHLLLACRERPLPADAMKELLPGIHALLSACSEDEVQYAHVMGDYSRQRLLKQWLESYEQTFKYKGGA